MGDDREQYLAETEDTRRRWGSRELAAEMLAGAGESPSDEDIDYVVQRMRRSASPGAIRQLDLMNLEIDVRDAVQAIRTPTLVMHRTNDTSVPVESGGWLAEHPRRTHGRVRGDVTHDHRQRSRTGRARNPRVRHLGCAGGLGHRRAGERPRDRGWRELVEQHHALVRRELARFRGREVDTAGDGFFAAFDGPARAIRCACAASGAVEQVGLDIRAGLRTGECELVDGKIGGLAVNIGARVAAEARAGEVLVSQTVRDLVAGSGLEFEERGAAELKGVPGEWRLCAVAG
jgi:class 3 adenylate cyclase